MRYPRLTGGAQSGAFDISLLHSGVDNQIYDLLDIRSRSLGDGIAVYNHSGIPAGFTGATGNMAGLLVVVPYVDDSQTTTGWDSPTNDLTPNSKTGQSGIWVIQEVLDPSVRAVQIDNYGHGPGLQIRNQINDGNPRGGDGAAIQILDDGTAETMVVSRTRAPSANRALVYLRDDSGSGPHDMLRLRDTYSDRLMLDSQGTIFWGAFNANGTRSWSLGPKTPGSNATDGVLTMHGSLEIADALSGGNGTPTEGISRYPGNHVLQFLARGSVVFDIRDANQFWLYGVFNNRNISNESLGAGTAALGTNCPAITPSAPYKWLKVGTANGSTGYIPIWK